jgi:outer membrane receptor protein involved in Fe transport
MAFRSRISATAALLAGTAWVAIASPAVAQEASTEPQETVAGGNPDTDADIVVTGIRASLQSALGEKRRSDNLVEVIQAQDIGKLPDQNLAEVLENVSGVQITRQAGVGTAVQIRGTDANRTEINGGVGRWPVRHQLRRHTGIDYRFGRGDKGFGGQDDRGIGGRHDQSTHAASAQPY